MVNSPATWCDPHPANVHPIPRDGRRHCGILEQVLRRQWNPAHGLPPANLINAVDELAALPVHIATRLAQELDEIWLGVGYVPDLDNLGFLRGHPIEPGSAVLWDQVPGVCTGRIIAIGTGDHVSASLVLHEVGHGLDSLDAMSQSSEWQTIMRMCRSRIQHPRYLNAVEWWAEAYALCASGQLGRLVRLLDDDENLAEMVWAYYRRHYGVMR
ncbi:hypothetical protein DQ384_36660 [Sphaerisporangium album]|uniref:Uncharacterized protein n=2 Tax=Sphaerisporangium album TaxID=509200 RepID=A0A367ESP4_9ACTN|nr:hypothetical protein DQ384_36660 [Sphaerisporangium album]